MAENLTQVNSYQDKLLEAMSIISSQLISSIPYDQTITCTIINDENKAKGQYKVTNGDATFDAYSSDTTLRTNDTVYVTIPEGNYDNQKIIQGKKTSNEEKPFVFTTPFDTILDLTGNLIPDDIETKKSLIANNGYVTEKVKKIVDGKETEDDIEIIKFQKAEFKPICHLKNLDLTGYTRLGLKANFMSWLPSIIKGSYGLRVTIIDNLNTTTTDSQEVANVQQTKTMLLDVSDMYGSPYNFENYYSQEKVFPISELNTITDIIIEFYQIAGSFYDINNNILNLQNAKIDDSIEGQSIYSTKYGENLFVDNVHVSLGYDVSEITDEYIVPIVKDSMTYSHFRKEEYNKKEIDLRWVHQFDDGPKVVEPKSDFEGDNAQLKDCEIRWYRYKLGAAAADEYSGVYWQGLTVSAQDEKYYLSDWDGTTKPIYQLDAEGNVVKNSETGEPIIIGNIPDYKETQALENVVFTPDISYQTEQIKAIIFLNGVAIRGPIITFRNEEDKTGESVDNFINALNIKCLDDSEGNYLIYNEAGSILNYADTQIERKLQCDFAEKGAEARSNLLLDSEKKDSISWKIPNNGSMIQLQGLERKTEETDDGTKIEKEYYVIYKRLPKTSAEDETELVKEEIARFEVSTSDPEAPVYKTTDYYILQKNATFNSGEHEKSPINQIYYPTYKINGQYSQYTMNNTIACTVQKDRIIYNAEQEMVFGVSGTMGSDYSIAIRFVEGHNAIVIGDTDTNYSLEVKMYDANNKPVQINRDTGIQWSWFTPGGNSEKQALSDNISFGNDTQNNIVELKVKPLSGINSFDINNLDKDVYIAQVTVGSNKITTYFPIPLKIREEFSHIEGATEVVYLSNGHPEYYKGDYKLYMITTDTQGIESTKAVDSEQVKWKIFGGDTKFKGGLYYKDEDEEDSGFSSGKQGLKPIGVYTEGVKNYGIICYYNDEPVWYQPILVIRNNYPSRVINKWDGKTLEIDEATGTILSTAIAAGRKDNNAFTGTMIGDWSGTMSDGSVTQATGVYGFHEGAMAYAFMDNGTAFIGKSGEGRIEFDCSQRNAVISSPYNMSIDLTSGQINAKTFSLKAGGDDEFLVLQTSTGGYGTLSSEKPLQIGKLFNVNWNGHVIANSANIGGWVINSTDETGISQGSIYSNPNFNTDWESIILDPVLNTVTGGKFRASILEAKDSSDIKLGGYIDVYALPSISDSAIDYSKAGTGKLGYIASNFGNDTTEGPGIGMQVNASSLSGDYAYSCVKATTENAGMSYNGSYLSLSTDAAILNFNGGNQLKFSNEGIDMTNTSGGRLIAKRDHIGMGFGDSYFSLYDNRTEIYDNNKIILGLRGTSTNTPYLLIGGTDESATSSIHLDDDYINLQKDTIIKNKALTVGAENANSGYTFYVGKGKDGSNIYGTGYFEGQVDIDNKLIVTGNIECVGLNSTISSPIISVGSILTVPYAGEVNFNNCTQKGIRAQFA